MCQLNEDDGGLTLRLGIGQKVDVLAGTWRYVPAYPSNDAVRDICRFLRRQPAGTRYKPERNQPRCPRR